MFDVVHLLQCTFIGGHFGTRDRDNRSIPYAHLQELSRYSWNGIRLVTRTEEMRIRVYFASRESVFRTIRSLWQAVQHQSDSNVILQSFVFKQGQVHTLL
jgi:hypothetical protein